MKVNTIEYNHGMQYVRGDTYGFDPSVRIHVTANIVGDVELGPNCRIDGNVTITGNVRIGRNCHIAANAALFGANEIHIGNHCGISAGARLFTGTDDVRGDLLGLHAENELEHDGIRGPIIILDYSIVGANSVIMPRAEMWKGSVLGALSLLKVGGTVPEGWIYAGVPAHSVRPRMPLRYT